MPRPAPQPSAQATSAPTRIPLGLVWLRRDLRLQDHVALCQALTRCERVALAFVFDDDILRHLPRQDRRVEFIWRSLLELEQTIEHRLGHGTRFLHVLGGQSSPTRARDAIPQLAQNLGVSAVFANHDDEPFALERDASVRDALKQQSIEFHTFKDHVVFERSELLTQAGKPYTVFTPYKRAWLAALLPHDLRDWTCQDEWQRIVPIDAKNPYNQPFPSLQDLGFEPTNLSALELPAGMSGARSLLTDFMSRIDRYDEARDYPAIKGPSYLSVHLRFGTLSIREAIRAAWPLAKAGSEGAATWLSELIWREFYHQVLHHHPHVVERSFKPAYDAVAWASGAEADAMFTAWCMGRTGYPLVDAAMHQLNQTGYMHNRLRMVVASFLTKDLGLDWRRGEAYFARQLNDFDLAANNGGWQWAASTGCDAQPYFRIFHPVKQGERFDPEGKFIRRYCPELAALPNKDIHAPWQAKPLALASAGVRLGDGPDTNYPLPIVDHATARRETLARYAIARSDLTPFD